jgi:hypothetical protein
MKYNCSSCFLFFFGRQLQGILTNPCNVDGRVKLEEFQRIVSKLVAMANDARIRGGLVPNRKYFSVFKMFVKGGGQVGTDAHKSYSQFCTEFTRDQRIALSNLGGAGSQLYVLPPALRDTVAVFAAVAGVQQSPLLHPDPADAGAVLYGVLTSKDLGPEQYVNAGFFSRAADSMQLPLSANTTGSGSKPVPLPPRPPAVAAPAPPVVPVVRPPVAAPAPTPAAPVAPVAAAAVAEDPIRKVANFCAAKGVQMIRDLQAKPKTKEVMPFLFEGHPDHGKFLAALKEALAANNAAAAAQK